MAKFQTIYNIGDVVYTANTNEVKKQIIKAVKISGLDHKETYYFEQSDGYFGVFMGFLGSDGYTPDDIFRDEATARKRQNVLKQERETQERNEKLERIKGLEEELAEARKELE